MGVSDSQGRANPAMNPDGGGPPVGFTDDDGQVLGTYVHDLFKNDAVVDRILSNVASMRGLSGQYDPDEFSQDEEYDKLANHLRECLDIGLIYSSMGID